MTKHELKILNKFEKEMIDSIESIYASIMLEQVSQIDCGAQIPSRQTMYRLITEQLEKPISHLVDGILISFLSHKYIYSEVKNDGRNALQRL